MTPAHLRLISFLEGLSFLALFVVFIVILLMFASVKNGRLGVWLQAGLAK